MMRVEYVFSSLADIAEYFRQRQKELLDRANSEGSRDAKILHAQAGAFEVAAEILKASRIEPSQ